MATAADQGPGNISETIADNFLTCSICLEKYTKPKILPCLHSFCAACLDGFLQTKGVRPGREFNCPSCRQVTHLPANGVSGLKDNYMLNNLQAVITGSEGSHEPPVSPFCEMCLRRNVTKFVHSKCLDCEESLCRDCAAVHCLTKLTVSHKIVEAPELMKGDKKLLCKKDSKPCRIYCATCCDGICDGCPASAHKDHTIRTSYGIRTEADAAITGVKRSLEDVLIKKEGNLKVLKDREVVLKEAAVQAKQDIHKQLQKLTDELTTRSVELVKEVESALKHELEKSTLQQAQTITSIHFIRDSLMKTSMRQEDIDKLEWCLKTNEELNSLYDDDRTIDSKPNVITFSPGEINSTEVFGNINRHIEDPIAVACANRAPFSKPRIIKDSESRSQYIGKANLAKGGTYNVKHKTAKSRTVNYKVESITEFGTRVVGDKAKASLSGISVSGDSVYIVDDENDKVKCFHVRKGHGSHKLTFDDRRTKDTPLHVLALEHPFVVVSYDNGVVKVFNGETGKFLRYVSCSDSEEEGYYGLSKLSECEILLAGDRKISVIEIITELSTTVVNIVAAALRA
eukprot:GHVT01077742.1.p1 GENE.GHVT01077742.1~~GHVT01077742.1.p1  ORF type:complete len:570 (+),score=-0.07 GHVT01077742.1:309-2018(+)